MKILVPVDGSESTKRMLGYLAAHDELRPAETDLHFLTVVLPVPTYPSRVPKWEMVEGYYTEEAERVLKPVRAFADQKGWTYRATFVAGHAAEAIARMAEEEKSDLIIMGSHGHTALGNVVLGSVANTVLARCTTPVLLVR